MPLLAVKTKARSACIETQSSSEHRFPLNLRCGAWQLLGSETWAFAFGLLFSMGIPCVPLLPPGEFVCHDSSRAPPVQPWAAAAPVPPGQQHLSTAAPQLVRCERKCV